MGFEYRLTEVNIRQKFSKNSSKGSGDMERTGACYEQTDGWTDEVSFASRRGTIE